MLLRYFLSFLCLFLFNLSCTADEELNPNTDVVSSNSETLNINTKDNEFKTFNEKFREKFHLPPTKKIYYHNIDKSHQPVTMDDYYKAAADKKRKDFVIPEPKFNQDENIILPYGNPDFRVIRYNTPPGQRNIDLSKIVSSHSASSPAILSPDNTKMVYTKTFFYPQYSQTASNAYYIPIKNTQDAYDILYNANEIQGEVKPIVSVGTDEFQNHQFKTLFPIDWSKDSSKIAFKEKIGSNFYETWQTNVIIYDFNSKSWKRLTAVREAIIYWWRENKKINLKDYLWDIFPVGWDKNNPECLVVYAYAFTNSNPLFLGTWSVDYNESKSTLISIDSANVEIDLNGFGIKEIKYEH